MMGNNKNVILLVSDITWASNFPHPDTIGAPGTYLNYASQGKAVRHAQQVQVVPVCVCRCHCRGDMVNTAMQKLNIKKPICHIILVHLAMPCLS